MSMYMLLVAYALGRFDNVTPAKIRMSFQNASPVLFTVYTRLIYSPHSQI